MIDEESFVITPYEDLDSAVMMGDRLFAGSGDGDDGTIVELAPRSGESLRTHPVPGRSIPIPKVSGLAQGLGRLWTVTGSEELSALDPDDGSITVFEDVRVWGISVPVEAGGRMWVAADDQYPDDGVLIGLTLDGSRVEVPTGKTSLVPVEAGGLLYISNFDSQSVTVVDPVGATVVDEIAVGPGPLWPSVIDDRLFVPNGLGDSVTVLNGASGGIEGEINVGAVPSHPLAIGDYIVVPSLGEGIIEILDRSTLERHAVVSVDSTGVPAGEFVYPSGYIQDLSNLKIGIPVAVNEETVAVSVLDEVDGELKFDIIAIDLPSGRITDRYPDAGAVQLVVVDSHIVTWDSGETAVVLTCS